MANNKSARRSICKVVNPSSSLSLIITSVILSSALEIDDLKVFVSILTLGSLTTSSLTGSAGLASLTGSAGLASLTGSAGLASLTGSAGLASLTGSAGLASLTGSAGLASYFLFLIDSHESLSIFNIFVAST